MGTAKAAKRTRDLRRFHVLTPREGDAQPDAFPSLYNISAGLLGFRFMPRPPTAGPSELVYVPVPRDNGRRTDQEFGILYHLGEWNIAWEAAHLRHGMFEDFPERLREIAERADGANVTFVPRTQHLYAAYQLLYHQLPRRTVERHGLPLLRRGTWPPLTPEESLEDHLPSDFGDRLALAFGEHVWPRLESGSRIQAFSADDPIKLLAHNLDFWLPHTLAVVEERLRDFRRVEHDSDEWVEPLEKARREMPPGVTLDLTRVGGTLWEGEDDAAAVTDAVIQDADRSGKLRSILAAVRANRVVDDFSERWSYAREDFERRLYRKRSRVRVSFVELTDAIPVHGPEAEVEGKLISEDFMAILDQKERAIVVLLSTGFTKLGDVAAQLGYANHSPVSKALARIRRKAAAFFDLG